MYSYVSLHAGINGMVCTSWFSFCSVFIWDCCWSWQRSWWRWHRSWWTWHRSPWKNTLISNQLGVLYQNWQ